MSLDRDEPPFYSVKITPTEPVHMEGIFTLYRQQLLREPDIVRIRRNIALFPSFVATAGGEIVGFIYTTDFAPDILELANILVAPEIRGLGIGGDLLMELEKTASRTFAAIVLVNSMLYSFNGEKKSAAGFYCRHGYQAIFGTQESAIFAKALS